jgi:hypothetical protein
MVDSNKKVFSVLSPAVSGSSSWLRGHLNHFFTPAISAADPAPRSMIGFAIAEHDSGHFCLTQENVGYIVNCVIPFAGSKVYEGPLRSRPHPARWATFPQRGEGGKPCGRGARRFQTAIGADQTRIRGASPDPFSRRGKEWQALWAWRPPVPNVIAADQTLIRRASPDTFSLREKGARWP